MWTSAGFLIAGFWALYFFPSAPPVSIQPAVWALARLTCPIMLAGAHFHVTVFGALLANAAMYASAGLIVEMLRRQPSRSQ
jgi:hypothetical protein